MDDNKTAM